jgi:hypothetical protein
VLKVYQFGDIRQEVPILTDKARQRVDAVHFPWTWTAIAKREVNRLCCGKTTGQREYYQVYG